MDEVRLGSRTLQPRRQLLIGGRREPLGKRALDILSVLAEAKGQIVTKDELLEAVWPGIVIEENALQVHVVALRKALGPEADRLETIRGVGYQLRLDPNATDLPSKPRAGPAPRLASEAFAAGPSIVVLPFENMSADPQQDYFADGITEDIITDLSQVSALKVIARNSAFAFKGKHVDVVEVARQLNVSHVLEGSVRRSDRRLRVSAQLIDGRTNDHIWAQRYDRDLANMFDLQDELAGAIVNALKINLLPSERRGIETRGTSSTEAYDLYVRARALRATMNLENVGKSLDAYRGALEIDPEFAMAWAGLASALMQNLALFQTITIDPREIDEALARATQLSPNLPDVIAARAQRSMFTFDWAEAEACIEAFEALPDASWSIHSHLLLALGRAQEGAAQQIKVWRADPLSPGANWGLQFHLDCAGRLEEAEAQFEKSRELSGMRKATEWEAVKRMMVLGKHEKVREKFAAWLAHDIERFSYGSKLGDALGRPDKAVAVIRQAFSDPAHKNQLHLAGIAHWATYLGDDDLAITAIRRATLDMQGLLMMDMWHPNFARVRRNPRYKDILFELGLVDHWRKTGNWGEFARPMGKVDFEIIA